jgi:hypothetical protein
MKFGLFGHKKTDETENEITKTEAEKVSDPVVPAEDDYDQVVRRLTSYTKKMSSTILVPVRGLDGSVQYYARELNTATSAEVACWASHICPPLYRYTDKVEDFDDLKYRETIFDLVVDYCKKIPEEWQQACRTSSDFNRGLFS